MDNNEAKDVAVSSETTNVIKHWITMVHVSQGTDITVDFKLSREKLTDLQIIDFTRTTLKKLNIEELGENFNVLIDEDDTKQYEFNEVENASVFVMMTQEKLV